MPCMSIKKELKNSPTAVWLNVVATRYSHNRFQKARLCGAVMFAVHRDSADSVAGVAMPVHKPQPKSLETSLSAPSLGPWAEGDAMRVKGIGTERHATV